MKNIFLLIVFSYLSPSYGISFFGDATDADCKKLAINFSNVGYFTVDNGDPFGSGVLINTKNPHLNGRVVLTAAHVLKDKSEQIYFNLGDRKLDGYITLHPEYVNNQETGLCSENDIAFFFLERPIYNVPLATLNLDISLCALMKQKWFALCGFGYHGPIDNPSDCTDTNRRACYSYASEDLNTKEGGNSSDSAIKLSPDCLLEPSGLSTSGDSGGGMFMARGGDLAGIIVTASGRVRNGQVSPLYQTSVLLSFHKRWITKTLDKYSEEHTISNYILPTIPLSRWEEKFSITHNIAMNNGQVNVIEEYTFEGGFPDSLESINKAIKVMLWWNVVKNRTLGKKGGSIRYSAAMNLFASSKSVVRNIGGKSLLMLVRDNQVSEGLRTMALCHLNDSEDPSLSGLREKAYRSIIDDEDCYVRFRIDAAHYLLDRTNDPVKCFELIKLIIRKADFDTRIKTASRHSFVKVLASRYGSVLYGFAKSSNPLVKNTAFFIYNSLLRDEELSDERKKIVSWSQGVLIKNGPPIL